MICIVLISITDKSTWLIWDTLIKRQCAIELIKTFWFDELSGQLVPYLINFCILKQASATFIEARDSVGSSPQLKFSP